MRDSGAGGLTVARRIRELCPDATLLYFADTAHVPYGDRSPAEVRHFALSISEFLLQRGAQILVFACNTTSAYALDAARARFAAPVVGVIEPGAGVAVEAAESGIIGVLATQSTVESGVYTRVIGELSPATRTIEVACPQFVPLVESGQTCGADARRAAAQYLAPLLRAGAQTVVLGCTHYPLLLPVLRELAPAVRFIDPAEAVAQEVQRLAAALAPVTDVAATCFISGEQKGVRHWAAQLLPGWEPRFERGPVFDS